MIRISLLHSHLEATRDDLTNLGHWSRASRDDPHFQAWNDAFRTVNHLISDLEDEIAVHNRFMLAGDHGPLVFNVSSLENFPKVNRPRG